MTEELASCLAQLEDAAHSLRAFLRKTGPDPQQLAQLDERLALWLALARRYKRLPPELPQLLAGWKSELTKLDAAADVEALLSGEQQARKAFNTEAVAVSKARAKAAPALARSITQAMQGLGMEGGRFEVALQATPQPTQYGMERRVVPGGRARRQHAAAGQQGGVGRRAVAHRAGHCRHHQPVGHGADPAV